MKYSFDNFRIVINIITMRMTFKLLVMIYLFYILRHLCRYFYISFNNIKYSNRDKAGLSIVIITGLIENYLGLIANLYAYAANYLF